MDQHKEILNCREESPALLTADRFALFRVSGDQQYSWLLKRLAGGDQA